MLPLLAHEVTRQGQRNEVWPRVGVGRVGQRRKIAERYAAGETMAELARDYDCGEATIWRALH
jgi:uncharacterized protein (DUF433 family)